MRRRWRTRARGSHDVSVQEDLENLAGQAIAEFGRIDVWMNNVRARATAAAVLVGAKLRNRRADVIAVSSSVSAP